jgi:hypothetical protein
MINELLDAVRNYLDITYTDNAGDVKLTGIIMRGQAYLNRIAGETLDYDIEGDARQLLFDYCRYVRSGALEDFAANFQSELLALQNTYEVKRYGEAHE